MSNAKYTESGKITPNPADNRAMELCSAIIRLRPTGPSTGSFLVVLKRVWGGEHL